MIRKIHGQHGISLIEALIALVILSVGLIAIAKLQSDLVTNAGLTKARSEAVSIADTKLEELRNLALRNDFDSLGSGTSSQIAGTNASYGVSWTVQDNGGRKDVVVTVSWRGPRDVLEQITASSSIGWDDPLFTASVASGAFGNPNSGRISPVEMIESGGPLSDYDLTIVEIKEATGDEIGNTGFKKETDDVPEGFYQVTNDEIRLLVDSDGNIVAITRSEGFSIISGRVFIDNRSFNRNSRPAAGDLEVIYTGARRPCTKLNINASAGNDFPSFEYQCVVTAPWSGRLGAYFVSGANSSDRFCVGDPEIQFASHDATRKPALDHNRLYRGFDYVEFERIDGSIEQLLTVDTIGAGNIFSNHQFVATRLGGRPTDASCITILDRGGAGLTASPSEAGYLGGAVVSGDGTYYNEHSGRFFCLTAECPDQMPMGPPLTTTLSGVITNIDDLNIVGLQMEGGICVESQNEFSCTIDWRGWAADKWSGALEVLADPEVGLEICDTVIASWEDNEGTVINLDGVAVDNDIPAITFDEIDPALTEMTLRFEVRSTATGCQ